MADQYGYVCRNLVMGILQLNFVLSPSFHFPSNILYSSFKMSTPIEYHNSATPEPYASAPMPPLLTFKEYEALALERSATEEKYDEAVNKHDEWKVAKKREEKEAWAVMSLQALYAQNSQIFPAN